tara:strand:- start:276 stop:1028 length:753 start_codon:yes stop_codon:yes gene_type:complete
MYFLRSYKKGNAKSGTTDIETWEKIPSFDEFKTICEGNGEGKYVLFERGKGIRGMRKINEHIVVNPVRNHTSKMDDLLVFAAEEFGLEQETLLSVKKQISLDDMDDDELISVLDQMAVKGAEGGNENLSKDIKSIISELKNRTLGNSNNFKAEVAESTKNLGFGAGMLVGGLGGVAATAVYYRKQMSDMETRLAAMESSMKETETELRKETEELKRKQKAEDAVRKFDSGMGLDTAFLSAFNRKNPAREF